MQKDIKALENKVRQLETELAIVKQQKTKYKKLFDLSADALSIIDLTSGRFIECNQAAVSMHGVESEQNFLNMQPSDLSPEFQPCGRRSDEMATEYIENTFLEGPQIFQWIHSRLDGTTFPCLVSLSGICIDGRNLVLAIGRDISDLIQTKSQLEEAISSLTQYQSAYYEEREKFERFVNLAPVGIAINKMSDGSFEYVNNEFSRFTGYTVEELNEMDYWQLTPQKYEDQEQIQLTQLAETGRYGPYTKEYIHRNGHSYPVLLSGLKIARKTGDEYIWSVVQDITEQQKVEKQIKASKDEVERYAFRMRLANDSAGIGVWEWDLRTNALLWDDWMYKLYGVNEDDFSGAYEAWEASVHQDDIEHAKTQLGEAIEGTGIYNPEFRVVHPNGHIRIMKASAEVIRDEDGNALKVIGVNYDVTDKTQAFIELNAAKQAAEDANQSKNAFLANMSHEIRTPMNAILGGLQLLNNENLSKDLKLILENASSSAKSLLTIINDILDYSKIAENKLDLEVAPFSMKEVVESVKFDVNTIASNKGILLESTISNTFSDGWLGDIVRVKQIVLNLVSNAVKFTDKGGVSIELELIENSNGQSIGITVKDSGIGMSPEAQARIFDRFVQADSSTTRKFGGTGLGMSITVNLIRMMNGSIELESTIGKGTTVKVELPLERSTDYSETSCERSMLPPDLTGKKVLVAEDNDINQVIIQTMLTPTNAHITMVANGHDAVSAFESDNFDLVLMDIQMPLMDGEQAQQSIQKLNSKVPVVALTANVMVGDVARYLEKGFIEHLGKPIDLNKLYGMLKRLL